LAAAELGAQLAGTAARVGLLVAGDGSARRGPKAPGYLDPRAASFDAEVGRALGSGDAAALLALDPILADDLLVAGRAPWQVLGGAVGDATVTATLDYAGDPFGVWYAVARWQVEPL
jgi:aromatic ring-opening dioxygenase LigB subunit